MRNKSSSFFQHELNQDIEGTCSLLVAFEASTSSIYRVYEFVKIKEWIDLLTIHNFTPLSL